MREPERDRYREERGERGKNKEEREKETTKRHLRSAGKISKKAIK